MVSFLNIVVANLFAVCSLLCAGTCAGETPPSSEQSSRPEESNLAPLPRPVATVSLNKQYVPVQRNDVTVAYKTAYFGSIYVGFPQPQHFTMVFDTGSAHLLLPSNACTSETCMQHRRYDKSRSETALDIDHDGAKVLRGADKRDRISITFGTGSVVGNLAQEVVCLGPKQDLVEKDQLQRQDCVKLRVVLAKEMTHDPFHSFVFDGVLGLGLDSLALHPEFSFFGQMTHSHKTENHIFAFFLSKHDSVTSEIAFGGVDPSRMASALRWTDVIEPDLGYWQIRIHGLRVGGDKINLCDDGGCIAILDTGTSLFGVPQQILRDLHLKLVRKVSGDSDELDCRNYPGPELFLDFGDFEVSLGAEDYSRDAPMRIHNAQANETQVLCRAALLKIDLGPPLSSRAFILGEPFLRKYYTAFDWGRQRIGFAPALQPEPTADPTSHLVMGKGQLPSMGIKV